MDAARRQRMFGLALPIVGGMVSQNLLNIVDTAMVGFLGDSALAAVGLTIAAVERLIQGDVCLPKLIEAATHALAGVGAANASKSSDRGAARASAS